MITLTDTALGVLTRSHRRYVQVQSWRNGVLLADDVPVVTAVEESDRSLRVPERVTLAVPRIDRGASWTPVEDDHPLAAKGQRLRVQLGVGLATGQVEWIQRGWFLVQDTVPNGDQVNVTAAGLLALIDEARLVSPLQPSGTLASALRALVEPALTVVVSSLLTSRAVPSGVNWDEDRLGAVLELLDAWPADAAVDPAGYLQVAPVATSSTPVLELTDGVGGTVIRASGGSTRDGVSTVVVARGTASDGGQVQGTAWDQTNNGLFNPLPVPLFFQSPLLTTVAQAQAAAASVLARRQRGAAVELTVDMVPHVGVQLGDVVQLTTEERGTGLYTVEYHNLPYHAGGGAARLRCREVVA